MSTTKSANDRRAAAKMAAAAQEAADARFLDDLSRISKIRRAEIEAAQEEQRRRERKKLYAEQYYKCIRYTLYPAAVSALFTYLYKEEVVTRSTALTVAVGAVILMLMNLYAYSTRNSKRSKKGARNG